MNRLIKLVVYNIVLTFVFQPNNIGAQIVEESNQYLPEVTVLDSIGLLEANKDQTSIDFKKLSNSNALTQFLNHNGVNFKSLGPGQLSTISLRGTHGASHIMQWEGIEINDPLVGALDFSNFSNFSNDQVSISHDGNGELGSVLNIKHTTEFDSLMEWSTNMNIVQNGSRALGSNFNYSNSNFSSHSEIVHSNANNDFEYEYQNSKLKRTHNSNNHLNIKQSFDHRTNANGQFSVRIWLNKAFRQIPFVLGSQFSDGQQEDKSNRFSVIWNKYRNTNKFKIQLALLNQYLHYSEPSINIEFLSKTNKYITKFEYEKYIASKWRISTELFYARINGQSTGINHNIKENEAAVSLKLTRKLLTNSLRTSIYSKTTYANNKFQPTTYGTKIAWIPNTKFVISGLMEKFIQLPSLNDLYWQLGGNINLKSSNGWGESINISYHSDYIEYVKINIYNKNIVNQIVWLPKDGFFNAINVPSTWVRGIETGISLTNILNTSLSIDGNYHFTRSTYQKSRIPNDNVIDKQLIYIPVHQSFISMNYSFKSFDLSVSNNWVGRRYTSSDNASFLNDYMLMDLFVKYNIIINEKERGMINVGSLNLFNKNYQLQHGWPMPGRQWSLHLVLQIY